MPPGTCLFLLPVTPDAGRRLCTGKRHVLGLCGRLPDPMEPGPAQAQGIVPGCILGQSSPDLRPNPSQLHSRLSSAGFQLGSKLQE